MLFGFVFFFKQKTAYEMRISDWSSDVCSSDLRDVRAAVAARRVPDVGVCGRDVEVAAHDQRLAWLAGLRQPAPQPREPRELGLIEDRIQRARSEARRGGKEGVRQWRTRR